MTKLAIAERSILFMNNLAGDDLWEYGHLLIEDCSKFSSPHELCVYKSSSRHKYDSQGLYMTSIPYATGRHESFQIYGFPFLAFDVDPSDIEYPSSVIGGVITQDMRMLDYFTEQDPGFRHIANPKISRLAWAKDQGLPTVLAVHHANGHKGDLKDLQRLVGMDIFCPVCWHDGEPNAGYFHKAIKLLLAEI